MTEPKVTERTRPRMLPGRKAGTLTISVTNSEFASFDLRVDVNNGEWIVVDVSDIYTCTDQDALKQFMRTMVKSRRAVHWTRYIVVDYQAGSPGSFSDRRIYETSDRRVGDDELEIGSVRLDWKIMDVSDPIQHPGINRPKRKYREVSIIESDPNTPSEGERYGREGWMSTEGLPDGAVLYTPERLSLLVEVRGALGRLDAKLSGLLLGDPDELASQLDRAGLRSGIAGFLVDPTRDK